MIKPQASGRYILSPHTFSFDGVAAALRSQPWGARLRLPRAPMPYALLWLVGPFVGVSRTRVK